MTYEEEYDGDDIDRDNLMKSVKYYLDHYEIKKTNKLSFV